MLHQYDDALQFTWNPKREAAMMWVDGQGRVMQPDGSETREIGKVDLQGDVVKKIAFFEETWQDDGQTPNSYLLVQSQSEKEGRLWFVPLGQRDPLEQQDVRLFSKVVPRDLKLAVSPKDAILATGDTTGTIRIWFASPTYETVTQVYDLRSDGDSPIQAVAFSGDGDTLITSDSNNRLHGWMSRD
jgi:WD40 repeat protein